MAIELKKGYTFFYQNTLWKVTEVYTIRWKDGSKSYEYKVKSDKGIIRYLEIETDLKNVSAYSFWEKIHNKNQFLSEFRNLEDNFVTIGKTKFPKEIEYKGVKYEFDERNDGMCFYDYEEEEVNSIDYTNHNDTKFFSIEVWDDEVEFSIGIPIKQHDISRIEKGKGGLFSSSILNVIGKNISYVVIGVFAVLSLVLNRCSTRTLSGDSDQYRDSTKVHRSNNSYRSRNTTGFGK